MNAYDAMFAIDCAAGAVSLVCIGGIVRAHFVTRKLRVERDDAIEAWRDEEVDRAHWQELAEDALANIEDLRERLNEEMAAAGRYAGKLLLAERDLRQIQAAWDAEKAAYSERQRQRGIKGNKSEKRRKKPALSIAA